MHIWVQLESQSSKPQEGTCVTRVYKNCTAAQFTVAHCTICTVAHSSTLIDFNLMPHSSTCSSKSTFLAYCLHINIVCPQQTTKRHTQAIIAIGLILWACQVSQTVKPSALLMLFTLLFECLKTLHLHLNITSQTSNWLIWGQLESQCVKPQLRYLAQIWFHLQPGLTSHCELQKAYKVTCMYHSRAARLMMVERDVLSK